MLVPGFTPVTTPVAALTVAILVAAEVQVPPVNPFVYVVVKPLFRVDAPAISGIAPATKLDVEPVFAKLVNVPL